MAGVIFATTDRLGSHSHVTSTPPSVSFQNTTLDHQHLPQSPVTTVVLPIILYAVFIIGGIGNSLVVYVMIKLSCRRKIADIFVINLSVADILFISVLPLWAIEFSSGRWVFGSAVCKIASALTLFSAYASVFFLAVMSIDRLLAVVFYKNSKSFRTWGKAKITVFVMWVVAGITSCMSLYFRESKYSSTTGHFHCRWNFDEHISSHVTWFCVHFLLRFFVGFGLPLGTMVVAYIIIIAYLQRRKSQKKLLRRKQDRVTLTVSTVVVVYLACFLPNQISNLIYMAQGLGILPQSDVPSLAQYNIHLVVTCLSWGHGCVNPFLYAFMREDVRLKLTETVNQIGCLVPIKDRRNVTEQTQQTRGQNSRKQTSRSYRSKESLPKQKETQPKPVTIIKAVHAGSPSNLQKCTKV